MFRTVAAALIFVTASFSLAQARSVTAWVPSYSIDDCKKRLQQDFGGFGMKDGLTYLPLQFWTPNGGSVACQASDGDIAWFKEWGSANDVKVLFCIYNAGNDWDWTPARNSFENNRSAFVNAIVAEVEEHGLDGADIDLEGPDLNPANATDADKPAYMAFLSELADKLHANGKVLTVATFADQWNCPGTDWWPEIEQVVDGHCSMGYDGAGRSGSYGSQRSLVTIPDKFMIGFPGWKDEWQGNTLSEQLAWIEEEGTVGIGIWDATLSKDYGFNNVSEWHNASIWERLSKIAHDGSTTGPFTVQSTSAHGSIIIDPQQETYEAGSEVTVTAQADAGYEFAAWSNTVGDVAISKTLVVSRNVTLTPIFIKKGEIIVNGDFEDGDASWALTSQNGAEGSGGSGNGAYDVTVSTAGTQPWDVQLIQESIPLVDGREYTLRFTASSDQSQRLDFKLGKATSPWTRYNNVDTAVMLSANPQEFVFMFSMNDASDYEARIEFNGGLSQGTWTIDDVSFMEGGASAIAPSSTSLAGGARASGLRVHNSNAVFTLSMPEKVGIKVHDCAGRLVAAVAPQGYASGTHAVSMGSFMASGAYVVTLEGNGWRTSQRGIVSGSRVAPLFDGNP